MKQFKININDLFEKSEVETMMDDVEKSSIIYEMNNINQKVLNEISTYANNRERIQNLTDELQKSCIMSVFQIMMLKELIIFLINLFII